MKRLAFLTRARPLRRVQFRGSKNGAADWSCRQKGINERVGGGHRTDSGIPVRGVSPKVAWPWDGSRHTVLGSPNTLHCNGSGVSVSVYWVSLLLRVSSGRYSEFYESGAVHREHPGLVVDP